MTAVREILALWSRFGQDFVHLQGKIYSEMMGTLVSSSKPSEVSNCKGADRRGRPKEHLWWGLLWLVGVGLYDLAVPYRCLVWSHSIHPKPSPALRCQIVAAVSQYWSRSFARYLETLSLSLDGRSALSSGPWVRLRNKDHKHVLWVHHCFTLLHLLWPKSWIAVPRL